MREILFRGKRKDNGEWVEGDYAYSNTEDKHYIICDLEMQSMSYEENDLYAIEWYEVIPETVGQYTGLSDKSSSNKKIFEGDYWIDKDNENDIMVVEYRDGQFCFVAYGYCGAFMPYGYDETGGSFGEVDCISFSEYYDDETGIIAVEIIGNIHDNPELLKGSVTDTNVGNITEKGVKRDG